MCALSNDYDSISEYDSILVCILSINFHVFSNSRWKSAEVPTDELLADHSAKFKAGRAAAAVPDIVRIRRAYAAVESDERLERERADRAHLAAILESKRARAGATEANELFILENK